MDRVVLECTVRLEGGSARCLAVFFAGSGAEKFHWQNGSQSQWLCGPLSILFLVEEFLSNNESIVAVTHAFCRRFNIPPPGSVPK